MLVPLNNTAMCGVLHVYLIFYGNGTKVQPECTGVSNNGYIFQKCVLCYFAYISGHVGSEDLTVVTMDNTIYWDVILCNLTEVHLLPDYTASHPQIQYSAQWSSCSFTTYIVP